MKISFLTVYSVNNRNELKLKTRVFCPNIKSFIILVIHAVFSLSWQFCLFLLISNLRNTLSPLFTRKQPKKKMKTKKHQKKKLKPDLKSVSTQPLPRIMSSTKNQEKEEKKKVPSSPKRLEIEDGTPEKKKKIRKKNAKYEEKKQEPLTGLQGVQWKMAHQINLVTVTWEGFMALGLVLDPFFAGGIGQRGR